MKKIETYILGMVEVNTYIIYQDDHAIIIDPGCASKKLIESIQTANAKVDAILLTHGHFDHIAGVDELISYYNCPLYINYLDEPLLKDPYLNFSMDQQVIVHTPALDLKQGALDIGAFHFEIVDAPGHSEGSSLIMWDKDMFCGDVIFQGSIGRCDLANSSYTKMQQTLKMIKQTIPYDITLYPGHGAKTTLQIELLTNPYMKDIL